MLARKAFVFWGVLGISTAVQAEWVENFLIGASGGYAYNKGILDIGINHPAPGLQYTATSMEQTGKGFIGGGLIGYQTRCNGWLMGLEFAVNWQDNGSDHYFTFPDALGNSWGASSHYTTGTVFDLTARMGFEQITAYFFPYIRAGIEVSRDKLSFNGTSSSGITASDTGTGRVGRFIGGVGLEIPVPLMLGLAFRIEYNYHGKGRGLEALALGSDNATLVIADEKPRTNSGIVSIIWNFY